MNIEDKHRHLLSDTSDTDIEYPISLDTALSIVGSLKVKAIKESTNGIVKEEQLLEQKIRMYIEEERMLYGGDDWKRLSVMDKVVNYYSPIIKKLNDLFI